MAYSQKYGKKHHKNVVSQDEYQTRKKDTGETFLNEQQQAFLNVTFSSFYHKQACHSDLLNLFPST